jgi:hypothetical protein
VLGLVMHAIQTMLISAQVGDGTTTNRNTPFTIAGLSSGVAFIDVGMVT